ncbi:right-handed parallel beta-helix repeat-containing protein [candidate division WOR-3 bacterium]|nr:right-handed parallel beta-helix repeat-containing protein [candidate division WOR-3 bacterium]
MLTYLILLILATSPQAVKEVGPLKLSDGAIVSVKVGDKAAIPQELNFQGFLTDADADTALSGDYDIIFKIYDANTNGNVLWTESWTDVSVEGGIFNVILGETQPIPDSVFLDYTGLWLELTIEGDVLTPRQKIVSVGRAYKAAHADTSDYAKRAKAATFADSSNVSANSYKLEGHSLTNLDTRWVNEGQASSITTGMILDGAVDSTKIATSAVTSDKIADGTIVSADVASDFKAPYADTADYALAANVVSVDSAIYADTANYAVNAGASTTSSFADSSDAAAYAYEAGHATYADTAQYTIGGGSTAYADSAGVAANAHALQGKDTTAFDVRYVNTEGPDSITGSGTNLFRVVNTNGESGIDVEVTSSSKGSAYGIRTNATSTSGTAYGGYFDAASSITGESYGIYGISSGSSDSHYYGIKGYCNNSSTGNAYGGYFQTTISGTGDHYGVYSAGYGSSGSPSYGVKGYGINNSTGNAYGGYFETTSGGTGVHYGVYAESDSFGIYAKSTSGTGNYAGYFEGNVKVASNITSDAYYKGTVTTDSALVTKKYVDDQSVSVAYADSSAHLVGPDTVRANIKGPVIRIENAEGDSSIGIEIHIPSVGGVTSEGLRITGVDKGIYIDPNYYGITLGSMGYDAITILRSAYGRGIRINKAKYAGVQIDSVEKIGFRVDNSSIGLKVANSDTGVYVKGAQLAGYFEGDVRVASNITSDEFYKGVVTADSALVTKKYVDDQVAGVSDNDWTIAGNVLHPAGQYGLSMRSSNTLHGNADSTHVNFGVACTTGSIGQNEKYCTVSGGYGNIASGLTGATVGGGENNAASGDGATVGGGAYNTVSNDWATVGGGTDNTASGDGATVGGGADNNASGENAIVSGGYSNTASDNNATVSGGYYNTASSDNATVGGGAQNTANGIGATICGGKYNLVSGDYSGVGWGINDTVQTKYSFAGGRKSKVLGSTSDSNSIALAGGIVDNASNSFSFGVGDTVNTDNTFGITADVNVNGNVKVASNITSDDFYKSSLTADSALMTKKYIDQQTTTAANTGYHAPTLTVSMSPDSTGDWVCDGTADDVEIQAALDQINTLGGGVVYVKQGTYNLSSNLTPYSNTILMGTGPGTVLNRTTATAINVNNKTRVVIENLRITGSCTQGIQFYDATDGEIKQCWIDNSGINGIIITGSGGVNNSHYNIIANNICSGSVTYGINIHGYENIIQGNNCRNAASSCIYLNGAESNVVVGNVVDGGTSGAGISLVSNSMDNTITGNTLIKGRLYLHSSTWNTVSSNTVFQHQIYIYDSDWNTVVGNTIREYTVGAGVHLGGGSDFNTISNNICYNHNSSGIYLCASSNNTVTDNVCADNGSRGILITGDSDYNVVNDNRCINNTSYGIGITSATCKENVIQNNMLKGNTGGSYIDYGTNTRDDDAGATGGVGGRCTGGTANFE